MLPLPKDLPVPIAQVSHMLCQPSSLSAIGKRGIAVRESFAGGDYPARGRCAPADTGRSTPAM